MFLCHINIDIIQRAQMANMKSFFPVFKIKFNHLTSQSSSANEIHTSNVTSSRMRRMSFIFRRVRVLV